MTHVPFGYARAAVRHVAIELLHAHAHERHASQQLDGRDRIVLRPAE